MAMPLSEINDVISASCDSVRATAPLVHCITNYVTVESCANAVLAVGGSPIMSDEPADVEDITSICDAACHQHRNPEPTKHRVYEGGGS